MEYMNKKERIQAALEGQETDRVPVSLWMHFSEADQDSEAWQRHRQLLWINRILIF